MPPPLFEVPGWSVSAEPASSSSSKKSGKRKRPYDPDAPSEKIESAQVNLEKLVNSLGRVDSVKRPPKKKHKGKQILDSSEGVADNSPTIVTPQKDSVGKAKTKDVKKPSKKPTETLPKSKEKGKSTSQNPKDMADSAGQNLTTFQKGMKKKLDGARFRWINETLYKSDSQKAVELMHDDPSMFQEYHAGFRQQVQSWPSNPVDDYINELKTCPHGTVIADLGCGDAALARALVPHGLNVLSYDLVPDGMYVIQADICASIPLPGSEPDEGVGEGHIVDMVVCTLSLMGSNWPKCIREAWRILKPTGRLKIAEVSSRFENVEQFVSLISSVGFKLKSKNEKNTHFTTFEFQRIPRKGKTEKDWEKLMSKGKILKPCEYKRR
ncbi:methyltransferase-domain-containing protein [Thelephora terrestris]|uniref:Ribosomal RNA-processing protein 8 n=1 Tax=Thelephora terrestris TaxID=56493 RepID=A0A9P6L5A6_9AGAM|nr:methyltransferase-domain-containing protein [Thelephora terrestris]